MVCTKAIKCRHRQSGDGQGPRGGFQTNSFIKSLTNCTSLRRFFMHNFFLAFNSNRVPVRFAGSRWRRGLNLQGRAGNIVRVSAD